MFKIQKRRTRKDLWERVGGVTRLAQEQYRTIYRLAQGGPERFWRVVRADADQGGRAVYAFDRKHISKDPTL